MIYFEFIKNRAYFYVIMIVICFSGIVFPAFRGLNWGLDFVGGTEFIIRFQKDVHDDQIRKKLETPEFAFLKGLQVQRVVESVGAEGAQTGVSFIIRTSAQPEEIKGVDDKLVRVLSTINPCQRLSTNSIGPVIGKTLVKNTKKAVFWSCVVILIYMWFRFELRPGIAATLGLVQDTCGMLAILSITGYEMDLTAVAAILTVLGYSINDAIVILDRVRENLRLKRKMPYDELVNLSINQCLGRTVYTSITVVLTLLFLLLMGPMVLRSFSLVLLAGVVSGCLSTISVTCPMLVDWHLLVDKPRVKPEAQKA